MAFVSTCVTAALQVRAAAVRCTGSRVVAPLSWLAPWRAEEPSASSRAFSVNFILPGSGRDTRSLTVASPCFLKRLPGVPLFQCTPICAPACGASSLPCGCGSGGSCFRLAHTVPPCPLCGLLLGFSASVGGLSETAGGVLSLQTCALRCEGFVYVGSCTVWLFTSGFFPSLSRAFHAVACVPSPPASRPARWPARPDSRSLGARPALPSGGLLPPVRPQPASHAQRVCERLCAFLPRVRLPVSPPRAPGVLGSAPCSALLPAGSAPVLGAALQLRGPPLGGGRAPVSVTDRPAALKVSWHRRRRAQEKPHESRFRAGGRRAGCPLGPSWSSRDLLGQSDRPAQRPRREISAPSFRPQFCRAPRRAQGCRGLGERAAHSSGPSRRSDSRPSQLPPASRLACWSARLLQLPPAQLSPPAEPPTHTHTHPDWLSPGPARRSPPQGGILALALLVTDEAMLRVWGPGSRAGCDSSP